MISLLFQPTFSCSENSMEALQLLAMAICVTENRTRSSANERTCVDFTVQLELPCHWVLLVQKDGYRSTFILGREKSQLPSFSRKIVRLPSHKAGRKRWFQTTFHPLQGHWGGRKKGSYHVVDEVWWLPPS